MDEAPRNAAAAGGSVVRAAAPAPWGGYFGYFSDPDGHLWQVTTYAS
ncbi:VOC family protein [Streptomyces hoynatensis]|nr:VOC family protein [Streptomyces hoynatensis]